MNNVHILGGKKGPPDGGGVVMVAVDIPAAFADRVRKGGLVPRELIFEQRSGELTAGRPVSLPVRELTPVDVLVMAQRAIAGGQIVPAIAFQIPQQQQPPAPKLDA